MYLMSVAANKVCGRIINAERYNVMNTHIPSPPLMVADVYLHSSRTMGGVNALHIWFH
jgi:hypothetical protein